MAAEEVQELNSSELGTKVYWDDFYKNERDNFEDHGDVGEVWFGEDSVLRVTEWLNSNYPYRKDESVIDIGCGNGMTLVEMAREGFKTLVGIDYSQEAISLASSVVKEQDMESCISLKTCDILTQELEKEYYMLALDKGTYDAISLHPENSAGKRRIYIEKVHKLLKPDGLFIITSCNWTDKELVNQFSQYFKLISIIPTPQFKFGGKIGNLVSSVVLQRIN